MFPPGKEFHSFNQPNFVHHLGVAYIQAYLAKHCINSKQLAPTLGSTLNECVKQIIATNAKIIGLTCYDHNYFLVSAIASQIKRRRPECTVIAGGPTATFSDELVLANNPDIDLCVRYEGEETTLELANLSLKEELVDNLEDIRGITYRRENSIVRTPDRKLFGHNKDKDCSLDGLPSPYLSGILKGTEGAGIISARGCTYYCTYCNFSAMSKHTIRYHSIDRIVAELRYISAAIESDSVNSRTQVITINDDAFTLNARRAKNICQRIIDEGIRLNLNCMCRADNLDEELIGLLYQAGFIEITFGVESAVPRVLNNIKKVYNAEQRLNPLNENYAPEKYFLSKVKEGIALAKRYGMKTAVSIILGLPGETINDGFKTIEFIRDLDVDFYEHNYLTIFSGTELFKTASNYGVKFMPSESLLPYDTQYAYPVHEIPFGDNSGRLNYNHKLAKIILKTFAGGPDTFNGIMDGIILASIQGISGNSFSNAINWLSQTVAIGGRIVLLGAREDTIKDLDIMLMANFKAGLATSEYYYLRSHSISGVELVYEFINKPGCRQLLQWDLRFPLVKLSKCIEFAKRHDSTQTQCFPIYYIKDIIDIYFLIKLADDLAKRINNMKSVPGVWLDAIFLDGCRWCYGLCPALRLQRVFINKKGEIFPCMTGQPLGNLSHDIKTLRNNARKLYDEIRNERKCRECPVDSRCSKCLFPHPLNQQEYCELQRANSNISGIITRSNLVNTEDFS